MNPTILEKEKPLSLEESLRIANTVKNWKLMFYDMIHGDGFRFTGKVSDIEVSLDVVDYYVINVYSLDIYQGVTGLAHHKSWWPFSEIVELYKRVVKENIRYKQ